MEQAIEVYLAITLLFVGASDVMRPADWAETYHRLHRLGPPGAFVNGGISLAAGSAIVAGHASWVWPGGVLTALGWLLVAKGAICLFAPDTALRSMARGAEAPRGFVAAGVVAACSRGWACYCLWLRT